jgi:hypothetical protein
MSSPIRNEGNIEMPVASPFNVLSTPGDFAGIVSSFHIAPAKKIPQ